jgi:shikimate kinase
VNLILLGLRCSGKTTAGRLAASELKLAFVDLDERTTRDVGASTVSEAWARAGERAFRAAESAALGQALAADAQLIALGGGTPTIPAAQALLRARREDGSARLVYLRCDPEALAGRMRAAVTRDRPPMRGSDAIAEIPAVFAERDPLYRELADIALEAGGLTSEETAALIVAAAEARLPAR